MTVSLRGAHPSQHRSSLAAVRSCFLLLLFAIFGVSAIAQGLSPGNPVSLGSVDLNHTATKQLTFSTTPGGADIQSVTVTTEGVTGKDFKLLSDTGCVGNLPYPDQCTIIISFTPSQIGIRLGALTITNTSGTVVNLINLSGIGVGPQFVFQPATVTTLATASGLTPATFTAGASVQDPNGNIFFTDVANNRILEESSTGLFTVAYSGSPLALTETSGLAIDGEGNLYVSSGANVYVLAPGATTLTILATPGVTLTHPTGLALDTAGDLYIADSSTGKIYQDVLGGNFAQALTLTGPGATLTNPAGLAVDANNTLYIADAGANRIVEVPITTLVTTVLPLTSLTLNDPLGVAVDAAGTVYIADTGNHRIVESTVQNDQFVLTAVPPLTLDSPAGVLVEGNGDLVVSDTTLGLVTVVRSTVTVNFPTPTVVGTLDTTDDPESLTVQETGNISSSLNAGTDPALSGTNPGAFLVATTGSCPALTGGSPTGADAFSIGEVCTYDLNFQPTVVGPNTANLVLSATAAGGLTASASASLYGIGLNQLNHFTLVAISSPATNPTTVNLGQSVELVLTAIKADGTVATDYTGTITFTTSDTNGVYQGGTGAGTNTTTYTMTAANNGVLTIPVASGLQLNQYGVWTATAVADPATVPPGANGTAVSNDIYVIEPSTLVLTSSVNPSAVNQSTTFTLTITTTGSITPAGTVTFFNNGVAIGSPVTVTGSGNKGTASIPDSFAAPGSYPITATYTPSTNTAGGTASLTQLVGNTTSVTITSSINPSLVGQSTNLTATITSLGTFGAPTGTIQFYDGGTAIGTPITVAAAAATLPYAFTTAGTHVLTAVYTSTNPDLTNATSGPYDQQVLNLASLSLTSSVNPSLPGQNTTLTATLTTITPTPTGTVKFYDGTTLIGTASLANKSASVTVSFTTTGNHILTAVYSGDTITESVTSPPLTQVVLYTTTITLTSSVNPVDVNANTTLTATVHASTGTPTGTVTFKSNGVTIGTGTLSGGVATLTTSFSLPGIYTLTAVYGGDAANQPGTSNVVLETVLNVVTINLSSSANPVFLDNPTTLTATLTTLAAGTTPTGTVSFLDGTTPIGTAPVVAGVASISASFVYAGNHSITAVYSGDAADAAGTSAAFTQVVADFSLTVATGASSSGTTIAGGTASYSLTVTPIITSTLPGPITLTFSGLPSTVTGVLTPSSIAAGSGATPVNFTVTAASLLQTSRLKRPPAAHHSPLGYAPAALALVALPLTWFRRRKRFASLLAAIIVLFGLTAGLSGCISAADTGYYGQTPQTYNLTVTATSGNLIRSTNLTLTVQ